MKKQVILSDNYYQVYARESVHGTKLSTFTQQIKQSRWTEAIFI